MLSLLSRPGGGRKTLIIGTAAVAGVGLACLWLRYSKKSHEGGDGDCLPRKEEKDAGKKRPVIQKIDTSSQKQTTKESAAVLRPLLKAEGNDRPSSESIQTRVEAGDGVVTRSKASGSSSSADSGHSSLNEGPGGKRARKDSKDSIEPAPEKPEKETPKEEKSTTGSTATKLTALAKMGYYFDPAGELRSIADGQKFSFVNQTHYERLGAAITEEIYHLMVTEQGLIPVKMPLDGKDDEPSTDIYVTPKIAAALKGKEDEPSGVEKIVILIHGSGAVRAGQWARSLIINENLDLGTMFPYIKRAKALGYDVIITNGNDAAEKGVPENYTTEKHYVYVWNRVVRRLNPDRIAIVAHSAGGYGTMKLISTFPQDFLNKVFAVALTDSAHGAAKVKEECRDRLKEIGRNWVTSVLPLDEAIPRRYNVAVPEVSAGHVKHEFTSGICISGVFKFLKEREEAFLKEKELAASGSNGGMNGDESAPKEDL